MSVSVSDNLHHRPLMHAAASPTAMSRLPSKQEAEAYIAKHGLAKHLQDALNTTIAEGVDDYTVRPLERIADLLYDAAPPERTHKPLIKQGTFALNAGSQKLFDLDHGATAASSLGRSPSRRGGLAAMKEAAQLHSALKAAHEEIKRLREKNALGIKHSTLAVGSDGDLTRGGGWDQTGVVVRRVRVQSAR